MNEASSVSFPHNTDLAASGPRDVTLSTDFVLNLTEIMRLLRRGIWVIVGATLAGALIAIYFVMQVTPTYTATSQILLGQQNRADNALGNIFQGLDLDTGEIAGQIAIMESGRLLTRVSRGLDLSRLEEFNPALNPEADEPSAVARFLEATKNGLVALLGLGGDEEEAPTVFSAGGEGERDPIAVSAEAEQIALGDQADYVGALEKGLNISQVGKTPLVDISFTSEDPVVAAAVANAVADLYIDYQLEEKFRATRRMVDGLNDRLADLRLRVEASERAVIEFRDEMLDNDISGQERFEQQIQELSKRLVAVSSERAELDAELSEIDTMIGTQGSLSALGVLDSEIMGELQQQRADLLLRRNQLVTRFGEDSPRIADIDVEVARVEEALGQEVARLREELASRTAVAAAREGSIRDQLRDLERRYLALSEELIRLSQLERESEASKLVYETFLTTFTQTSEAAGLQEADAQVVAYANPPKGPSAPNKKVSTLLGLVAGLFLGVALVLVRALRDQSIDSVEKMRRLLGGVPVVATIPAKRGFFTRGSPLEAIGDESNLPLEEAARTLRNTLMLRRTTVGWKIAVISALPSEGKTTTSLLLAHAAVKAGKSCVVVETDLRRSSITRVLHQAPHPDLVDVLEEKVELHEALRRDAITGAYILPAQPGVADPAGLLLSERMQELIRTLEKHFDIIVFDTAPLLSVTDALPVASYSDDVVLAVRWRRNSVKNLWACLTMLREANVSLTCAVMTMAKGREFSQYQDYYTKGTPTGSSSSSSPSP
jgi:succinoglycan biosynthesis transport protein ExoP